MQQIKDPSKIKKEDMKNLEKFPKVDHREMAFKN